LRAAAAASASDNTRACRTMPRHLSGGDTTAALSFSLSFSRSLSLSLSLSRVAGALAVLRDA
jgi:hypothetical protein